MKYLKFAAIAIALAVLTNVLGGQTGLDNPAHAQTSSLIPQNISAVDGTNPGAVVISWNAVTGAAYYRVGWVQILEYNAVAAAGRPWTDAFYFVDVKSPATSRTVTRLVPGTEYYFLVGGLARLDGKPQWNFAEIEALTLKLPGAYFGDYDADNDGLIEITTLAQLDAIRHDLDGDGNVATQHYVIYTQAFTNAARDMGCPSEGCHGYELAADLDFDTNANGQADAKDTYWNDGKGWEPIGHIDDAGTLFALTATFDGNSHTISNLHINRPEENFVGLFGIADFGNVIKSVNLESVNVTGRANVGALTGGIQGGAISDVSVSGSVSGTADDIGGLVGDNRNGSTIANSHSTASVSGYREVGGLVGFNLGSTISNSSASGSASGTAYEIGGLVGDHSEGSVITDSYSTAAVSGNQRVGGLVGYMSRSSNIIRSHADGDVTANGDDAGGLVGRASLSTIIASYATGDVTGNGNDAGGLVGDNLGGVIYGAYATGNVSGTGNNDDAVGGLVGRNGGRIYRSYATGSVSGSGGGADRIGGFVGRNNDDAYIYLSYSRGLVSETTDSSDAQVGGLVGKNYADANHVVDSYWDTQTSGQTTSDDGDGKTTTDLQTPTGNTGIYEGWGTDWWDYGTASQYPVLSKYGLDPAIQR